MNGWSWKIVDPEESEYSVSESEKINSGSDSGRAKAVSSSISDCSECRDSMSASEATAGLEDWICWIIFADCLVLLGHCLAKCPFFLANKASVGFTMSSALLLAQVMEPAILVAFFR
ncbi:hypothetical protein ACOSP7_006518 [Xanthoceras sorbifolium]